MSPIVELLEANRFHHGQDITVTPFHYGTNITLLAKSIQTYIRDKESRSGLAPKKELGSESAPSRG
jgi:hypothetical protein